MTSMEKKIDSLWELIIKKNMTNDFKKITQDKIIELKKLNLPTEYIYFLETFGAGAVQKDCWPTYIIYFESGTIEPNEIYSVDGSDKEKLREYSIFAFNLDGSCVAFKNDGQSKVYLISVDGIRIEKIYDTFILYLEYLVLYILKQDKGTEKLSFT